MGQITVDLWPDISLDENLVTPAALLRQQASLLGEKTGNLVVAEVNTISRHDDANPFGITFDLIAPAMDNYRFNLFSLIHPIECYPLKLYCSFLWTTSMQMNNQEELENALREVFAAPKTQSVIKALVAQSTA